MKALLAMRYQAAEILEAADGAEAARRVQEVNPDVVQMDTLMPEMDGLQSTRLIKAVRPEVRVIALSMYPEYRAAALGAGAAAFVGKGDAPDRRLRMIAEVSGSNSGEAGDAATL